MKVPKTTGCAITHRFSYLPQSRCVLKACKFKMDHVRRYTWSGLLGTNDRKHDIECFVLHNGEAFASRVGQKMSSFAVRGFGLLIFYRCKDISRVILLLSQYFPALTSPQFRQWISLSVPCWYQSVFSCHQPSCHSCFHLTIVFSFVGPKILFQRCKQTTVARSQIPRI